MSVGRVHFDAHEGNTPFIACNIEPKWCCLSLGRVLSLVGFQSGPLIAFRWS